MFSPAIFKKTLRDSSISIALSAVGIVGFQVLFVWAMLNMGTDLLKFVSNFPFLIKIFEMGFGIKVDGEVSINIMFAVCYTHAVVLALTWSVIIATTTRTTVGEIERGTADMLLSLPVTRPEVYFSTSLVWWFAAGLLSFCPLLGIWIAVQFFQMEEPVVLSRFVAPGVNFFALNLAIGGLSSMVACLMNRRGVAIGTIVAIALSSVVLNFIEPFIEAIKSLRFLSLLNYFRPVDIVRTGEWPVTNMLVIVAFAAACWTIGLITFSRGISPPHRQAADSRRKIASNGLPINRQVLRQINNSG